MGRSEIGEAGRQRGGRDRRGRSEVRAGEREKRDGEDEDGASGPAGVGEHSGVNRVQPQLGSLQPGSLRFTHEARSRVFGCENRRCRIGRLPIRSDFTVCFFAVIISRFYRR